MAANWINTLTSSEQWRSERKEGRKRKGVQLAGSTCVLRSRRDESKTIKNVSRRLIKSLGLVAISKVTR